MSCLSSFPLSTPPRRATSPPLATHKAAVVAEAPNLEIIEIGAQVKF
jgi:hypothetical protein